MILDTTVKEVLNEVQFELKKEGYDISIEEITNVVMSQSTAAMVAFKKGLAIRIPYFGLFSRKHALEKGKEKRELNALKDSLTEIEFENKVLEAKLRNKLKTKNRKKALKPMTILELKDVPNTVKTKTKYDNIL